MKKIKNTKATASEFTLENPNTSIRLMSYIRYDGGHGTKRQFCELGEHQYW
jgi:hypothetical protein